jgi:hypothetical protein
LAHQWADDKEIYAPKSTSQLAATFILSLPPCNGVHLVNLKTGKTVGEHDED